MFRWQCGVVGLSRCNTRPEPVCGAYPERPAVKAAHSSRWSQSQSAAHKPIGVSYDRLGARSPGRTMCVLVCSTSRIISSLVWSVFMGTSSSWAFARRVIGMTCNSLDDSLCPGSLLFDGHVYDIKWDGNRTDTPEVLFDTSNLPTPDFAGYLINSVKFHCGQLFYLFDESSFMAKFGSFQTNPAEEARSSPLWFCHYLLIIAFGKSFVVQSAKSQRPSGSDHFIQAMKCIPDFNFFEGDPIEKTQILCCAALYLQCLNSRAAAYRMVYIHEHPVIPAWPTTN